MDLVNFMSLSSHSSSGFKLSIHICLFYFPESPMLYCVSNVPTFGISEVELAQLVVDGVKLLITMEKRLESGRDIDEVVPSQK